MGFYGLNWSLALIIAPALGMKMLAINGSLLWLVCGALGLLAAAIISVDFEKKEVAEETALLPADYRAHAHWDCVVSDGSIAMIRILDLDWTGAALRARIEANLAQQVQPELAAIYLVHDLSDLTGAMPRFVTAFLQQELVR